MKQQGKYSFERLSKDNLHHLIHLYQAVFNRGVSLNFLQKKYNTPFIGKEFLGHIAFDGYRPVAYGGYIPHKFKYNHIVEIGAQSVDSMALPEVNGKGVFTAIYEINEALLKSEGIHFGYGFANQHSEPVFVNKFGWTTNERLLAFAIQVKGLPLSRMRNKMGLAELNGQIVNSILAKLPKTNVMPNPFAKTDVGYNLYDEDFIQYKSFQPHYILEIEGIQVWLKADRLLSIGNISPCSELEFSKLILKLKGLAKQMGLNQILFQFSPGCFATEYLRKITEPIEGSAICFKAFSTCIPLDKILFSNADIDTF